MDACAFNGALLTLITRALRILHSLFLVTILLLPAILLAYWTFIRHFLLTIPTPKGWSFHHQLSASSARSSPDRASRHSSTNRIYHQRSLPISADEFFLFFTSSGFGICPFAEIYPHGPICLCFLICFFFLARLTFFTLITTHTACDQRAGDHSREALSSTINERLRPFGIARNRASERATTCTDAIGTGTVVLKYH